MRKRPSLSLRRRLCNGGAAAALWISALLCCALLLFLTGYIFYRGLPGISWDFLTGAESILQGTAGILPAIVNTLYVLLLSLAIALPIPLEAPCPWGRVRPSISRSTPGTGGW